MFFILGTFVASSSSKNNINKPYATWVALSKFNNPTWSDAVLPRVVLPKPNNFPIRYGNKRPADEDNTKNIHPIKYNHKYGLMKYNKFLLVLFNWLLLILKFSAPN